MPYTDVFNSIKKLIGNGIIVKQPPNDNKVRVDMHTHPDYLSSEGMLGFGEGVHSIKEMLEQTVVDAIAVTPHFKMQNTERVQAYADKANKIVIHGKEVGVNKHVLVYAFGVTQQNADQTQRDFNRLFTAGLSLDELIKRQDYYNNHVGRVYALVCPAHYADHLGLGENKIKNSKRKPLAIETSNSDSILTRNKDSFAREIGIAPIGGSDAHRKEFIGMGGTILDTTGIDDSMDVYECIINNKTSTYCPELSVSEIKYNQTSHRRTAYYWLKLAPWILTQILIK